MRITVWPSADLVALRSDVIEIPWRSETSLTKIEKSFGIADFVRWLWLAKADTEGCLKPATAVTKSAEVREANKRLRLLEMVNKVVHRVAVYLGRDINPK